MAKGKVVLGAPERPAPTSGFVRQKIEGMDQKMDAPSRTRAHGRAGTPSKGGVLPAGVPADAPPRVRMREGQLDIDDVLAVWRQLPAAERKQCLALMSLEHQRGSAEVTRDVDLWSEAVYEALRAALGPSDGSAHGPRVIRAAMGASNAWGPVAEFLEVGNLASLKPAEKFAVFRLLAKLLVTRSRSVAQHAGIPLTVKLVANNAQNLPGIFDAAFPGYLASGMVLAVARRLMKGAQQ